MGRIAILGGLVVLVIFGLIAMFQIDTALRSARESNQQAATQRADAAQLAATELEPVVGGFATIAAGTSSVTIDLEAPDAEQLTDVVDAYRGLVEGWNEDEAGARVPNATVTAGDAVTMELSEDSEFGVLAASMPAAIELAGQGGSVEFPQFHGVILAGPVDAVRAFALATPADLEELSFESDLTVVADAGDFGQAMDLADDARSELASAGPDYLSVEGVRDEFGSTGVNLESSLDSPPDAIRAEDREAVTEVVEGLAARHELDQVTVRASGYSTAEVFWSVGDGSGT